MIPSAAPSSPRSSQSLLSGVEAPPPHRTWFPPLRGAMIALGTPPRSCCSPCGFGAVSGTHAAHNDSAGRPVMASSSAAFKRASTRPLCHDCPSSRSMPARGRCTVGARPSGGDGPPREGEDERGAECHIQDRPDRVWQRIHRPPPPHPPRVDSRRFALAMRHCTRLRHEFAPADSTAVRPSASATEISCGDAQPDELHCTLCHIHRSLSDTTLVRRGHCSSRGAECLGATRSASVSRTSTPKRAHGAVAANATIRTSRRLPPPRSRPAQRRVATRAPTRLRHFTVECARAFSTIAPAVTRRTPGTWSRGSVSPATRGFWKTGPCGGPAPVRRSSRTEWHPSLCAWPRRHKHQRGRHRRHSNISHRQHRTVGARRASERERPARSPFAPFAIVRVAITPPIKRRRGSCNRVAELRESVDIPPFRDIRRRHAGRGVPSATAHRVRAQLSYHAITLAPVPTAPPVPPASCGTADCAFVEPANPITLSGHWYAPARAAQQRNRRAAGRERLPDLSRGHVNHRGRGKCAGCTKSGLAGGGRDQSTRAPAPRFSSRRVRERARCAGFASRHHHTLTSDSTAGRDRVPLIPPRHGDRS